MPETRHTMNAYAFAKMKEGAFFINTGRGALVDDSALYDALKSGKLASAASDVFDPEPPLPDNKLFTLENFICTPHWGSDTIETIQKVGVITAQATVDVVCKGIDPVNYVNT
jgi:D-3-phosphoglycerate dehydrogenase